jgi:hypothetical protein
MEADFSDKELAYVAALRAKDQELATNNEEHIAAMRAKDNALKAMTEEHLAVLKSRDAELKRRDEAHAAALLQKELSHSGDISRCIELRRDEFAELQERLRLAELELSEQRRAADEARHELQRRLESKESELETAASAHAITRERYDRLKQAYDLKGAAIVDLQDAVSKMREEMLQLAVESGVGRSDADDLRGAADVQPLSDDEIDPPEDGESRYDAGVQRSAWLVRHSGRGARLGIQSFQTAGIREVANNADECVSFRDAGGNYTTFIHLVRRIRRLKFSQMLRSVPGIGDFKIVRIPMGKSIEHTRYFLGLHEAVQTSHPSLRKELAGHTSIFFRMRIPVQAAGARHEPPNGRRRSGAVLSWMV